MLTNKHLLLLISLLSLKSTEVCFPALPSVCTHLFTCVIVHSALTRSRPLSGGTREVQGFAGIVCQKLIDVLRTKASLLTNHEAPQGSHCHICPVHLQIHQKLLEHQKRLWQQGEIVLPGCWWQSQQHLEKETHSLILTQPEDIKNF